MKFKPQQAPHIFHTDSICSIMGDVLITTVCLYFMAFYYYGIRSLLIGFTAVATCCLSQMLYMTMMGKKDEINLRDWSPAVTGMIISLMLPASIPFSAVIIICMFAILVAKAPFGRTGENLFNPAAAGIAFGVVCWGPQMFSYPQPMHSLPIIIDESVRLVSNPSSMLKLGGIPPYTFSEIIFGNVPGPMGATNILVITACLIFLLCRGTVRWHQPVAFIAVCTVFAFLFPRISYSRGQSVLFELFSGSLLFAAVFMLNDPVTSPKREIGRLMYGAAAGIITMLARYFGSFPQGACFAILLVNSMCLLFDMFSEKIYTMKRRELREFKFTFGKAIR